MNNVEETLWNYIDGNCTPFEQKAISTLIAGDEVYRLKYQELLDLSVSFSAMELDEPPMAFTYNVMEAIRTEHAQTPLKATINKRIIKNITIFFVLAISVLLVFTFANINLSGGGISVNMASVVKVPDVAKYITKPVILGALFFDLVLALYLFDNFLRLKNMHVKG